jgi:GT2 family glycosyltransferase
MHASKGLEAEWVVVDNASTDGSMEYLPTLFPGVRFMFNEHNLGFAKANNQALAVCRGEFVLFLNPDTLIPEDSLHKCIDYMNRNPQSGALGVRMLDGRGRFLPESKRSFPSPMVSFFKLTGLAALFPRSGIFNRYALGNLNQLDNHKVEVLAGAFMLVRRELLLQLNGFDETYFLYGEDIDLSFRMRQAGYENHYFAETSIIHFKGESSGNKELIRVKYFYSAMLVFVNKHYRNGTGKLFAVFLRLAIALRGLFSAGKRLLKPAGWQIADALLVWTALQLVRMIWITVNRNGKDFKVPFVPYALPFFSLVFIACAAFTGLYDRKYKTSKTLVSIGFAVLGMLAVYSLLPEQLRFSRGVIVCGGSLGGLFILLLRHLLLLKQSIFTNQEDDGNMVAVATGPEYEEIKRLLQNAMVDEQLLGRMSIDDNGSDALFGWKELPSFIEKVGLQRIIFCIGKLSMAGIIARIELLKKRNIRFLFHVSGSASIVGSHQLSPSADIVTDHVNYTIHQPYQQRMKRMVDVLASLIFLPVIPFYPKPRKLARNIYQVIKGSKTWVGYATVSATLPFLKKGIITPLGNSRELSETLLERSDRLYAKNYDWWQDMVLIFRNYRNLGR